MSRNHGKPWRTLECDGYEVLIGRGVAGNVLVTNSATSNDLWLHVGDGVAGAHVLIRGGAELWDYSVRVARSRTDPDKLATVERVAAWAAWHSGARSERLRVAVLVTLGRNVDGANADGSARVSNCVVVPALPEEPPVTPVPNAQPPGPNELHRAVGDGLRSAIAAHGPIDARSVVVRDETDHRQPPRSKVPAGERR